jgi:hypothetical protein
MVQGSYGTGFALETIRESLVRYLDRDCSPKSSVARLVHRSHPALSESFDDLVRAEVRADLKRH